MNRPAKHRSAAASDRAAAEEAAMDEYVEKVVAGFPPLTPEEKAILAPLWRPGVIAMHRAIREREAAARRAGTTAGRAARSAASRALRSDPGAAA